MKFSRQEYWSGLPFPTPRALPDPGIDFASALEPRNKPITYGQWIQQSLTFLAPGTGFMGDNFSMNRGQARGEGEVDVDGSGSNASDVEG